MNRTLKDATVKRYHYASHDQLREHLDTFVKAYNGAKHLKTLRGLTAFKYDNRYWTVLPNRVINNPAHHFPGLNTGMLEALAAAGAVTTSASIDSTYVKAQRAAFGGKGGRNRKPSARRGAGGPASSIS